jgi:hypothetical protein
VAIGLLLEAAVAVSVAVAVAVGVVLKDGAGGCEGEAAEPQPAAPMATAA